MTTHTTIAVTHREPWLSPSIGIAVLSMLRVLQIPPSSLSSADRAAPGCA
jgi:hypothetical protein